MKKPKTIKFYTDNSPYAGVIHVDMDAATDLARERLEIDREPTEEEIMEAAEEMAVGNE